MKDDISTTNERSTNDVERNDLPSPRRNGNGESSITPKMANLIRKDDPVEIGTKVSMPERNERPIPRLESICWLS
jgi:hypothetical protein